MPVGEVMADIQASPGNEPEVLRELLAATGAHRLIIGPRSLSNVATFEMLEAIRMAGARVSLLPDMLEVVGSSVDFDELYGITLLGVRRSALSRSSRVLKRGVDLTGATVLTLCAAPLMLAIAALIRVDSRGPALFGQLRTGRDGTPFRILKLRTMVADAEALKPGLREFNEAGGLSKIAGSARVPLDEMVKLDHLYVSNWTPWSDVKIPLRTVPCVFGKRGMAASTHHDAC